MTDKPNYMGIDLAFNLPADLREPHQRIYEAAVQNAKALGWDPELHDEDN